MYTRDFAFLMISSYRKKNKFSSCNCMYKRDACNFLNLKNILILLSYALAKLIDKLKVVSNFVFIKNS